MSAHPSSLSDRELLELAAKAAGYTGQWDADWYAMCDGENHWDPLRHNGQALRLAVKLDIAFMQYTEKVSATTNTGQQFCEWLRGDPYAATRRAIVRAAAALAK